MAKIVHATIPNLRWNRRSFTSISRGMLAMYCDECGALNGAGATVCRVCGRSLAPRPTTDSEQRTQGSQASGQEGLAPAVATLTTAPAEEAQPSSLSPPVPSLSPRPRRPRSRTRRIIPAAASARLATLLSPAFVVMTGERWLIGYLLLASFALRLWRLGSLPAFLTEDETQTLEAAYRISAAWGPGLFGLDWRQLPALDGYLLAPLVSLFGSGFASARLVSAIISTVALVPFYRLARSGVSLAPALGGTAIFAAGFWYLGVSRDGTDALWPLAELLFAMWAVERALDGQRLGWWFVAGILGGLGLYGPPIGHLVLIILVVLTLGRMWHAQRKRDLAPSSVWRGIGRGQLVGLELILCVALLLFLPQLPASFAARLGGLSAVATTVSTLRPVRATPWVGNWLFAAMPVDAPSLAALGMPLLDIGSLFLAVVGLGMAWRRLSASLAWYVTLVVALALGWVAVRTVAGIGWGYLLIIPLGGGVCYGLQGLADLTPDSLARWTTPGIALISAVVVAFNVWAYRAWFSLPASSLPVSTVLPANQFTAWHLQAMHVAAAGDRLPPLNDWLAQAPPPAPEPVASQSSAGGRNSAKPSGQPVALVQASTSLQTTFVRNLTGADNARLVNPRGVAVDQHGTVYVADPAAHLVFRFDAQGTSLPPLTINAQPQAQPWDLGVLPDGTVVVDDAEAGLLYKIKTDGTSSKLGDLHLGKPRGIDVGANGLIYVAETAANHVLILSADGQQVGQVVPSANGLPKLDQPTDVASLSDASLVVAEPNADRFETIDSKGALLGAWKIPHSDTFSAPHLAALPDGGIVVSDPAEHRVIVLDPSMAIAAMVGSQGRGDGQFGTPVGVATDRQGTMLYVADPELARVAVFQLRHG